MDRRTFLGQLALTAAGAAAAQYGFAAENKLDGKAKKRPNILFCIADDASYAHMSAYGCTWVKTPAFDRVAREGILFTQAYTPHAKCAPSRASILTGRNAWQLEEGGNHWCYFPAKFGTFMDALGANGYVTGFTGKGWAPGVAKTAEGTPRSLTGQAWQRRTAPPPAKGIARCDYAANFADFLNARPEGQPFCFWYGGHEPHRGYEFGSGVAKGGMKPGDIDRVPAYWPDNPTVRNDMLDYAFELEHFDKHLGRMLAELEKRGELDNTLVVVTSDNGMPFPRCKGQSYENSNHMPLAIRWPQGIQGAGRKVEDLVSFIDFAPTFLEAAGFEQKQSGMQPLEGRSLTEIFKKNASGRVTNHREWLVIGKERYDVGRPHDEGYPIRGIITGGWLYLNNLKPERWPTGNPETGYTETDGGPTKTECIQARTKPGMKKYWEMSFGMHPAEELYRIDRDPECLENLAEKPEHAETMKKLKEQLFAELRRQGDPRVVGGGEKFDEYPFADPDAIHFYERHMSGEKLKAGWIRPTDYDPAAAQEEKK